MRFLSFVSQQGKPFFLCFSSTSAPINHTLHIQSYKKMAAHSFTRIRSLQSSIITITKTMLSFFHPERIYIVVLFIGRLIRLFKPYALHILIAQKLHILRLRRYIAFLVPQSAGNHEVGTVTVASNGYIVYATLT